MKKTDYLIILGIAAATGAGAGLLTGKGRKGAIGAAAGAIAGSLAAGLYMRAKERDKVPFYSNLSPLYDETEAA